jgi:hypothetical protein
MRPVPLFPFQRGRKKEKIEKLGHGKQFYRLYKYAGIKVKKTV